MNKKMMSFVVLIVVIFCALYYQQNGDKMWFIDEIETLQGINVREGEGFTVISGNRRMK